MGLRIFEILRSKKYVVFGSGTAAANHVKQFSKIGCKLLAVHNPSGRSVPGFCNTTTGSLLELDKLDPDFFVIASPNHCHIDQIKYTVNRNIPALIEKPTITDRKGLEWLKDHTNDVSRLCMSAQNLRYQLNTVFLREWLKKQTKLPNRIHVEWCRDIWDSLEPWKKDAKKSGGGILLDWGTHAVDLVFELFPELKFRFNKCNLRYDNSKVDQHAELQLMAQNHTLSATAKLSWLARETGNKPLELKLEYQNQVLTWRKSGSISLATPTSHHYLFDKTGSVMHKTFIEHYVDCQSLTQQKINQMRRTIELLEEIISFYDKQPT